LLAASLLAVGLLLTLTGTAVAAEKPTVILNPTIPTTETSAELSGSVDIHGGEETVIIAQATTDPDNWPSGEAELVTFIPAGTTGATPFNFVLNNKLQPETTYSFRILASSPEWEEVYSEGPPFPQATTANRAPKPPLISDQYVTSVSSQEATLNAEINPRFFATSYLFEYAPRAAIASEGWSSPSVRSSGPLPSLPADGLEHLVSAPVTGLTPGEQYRWRVVAENSGGQTIGNENSFATVSPPGGPLGGCPNEPFRIGFGAYLPDCRAYEQATPTDKGGLNVQGFADFLRASSDSGDPRVAFIDPSGSGIPAGDGGRQDLTPLLSSKQGGSRTRSRTVSVPNFAEQG